MSVRVGLGDEGATRALGALIARHVTPGDVILLCGELGAGKTTMTQGLVAELGVVRGVTSPTFALCHLYDSDPVVAHVDCWRLVDPRELVDLALDEVLENGGVAVIEWGERAAFLFDDRALMVTLEREDDRRVATLSSNADTWNSRLGVLAKECTQLEADR